jgi:hypothetical protein
MLTLIFLPEAQIRRSKVMPARNKVQQEFALALAAPAPKNIAYV